MGFGRRGSLSGGTDLLAGYMSTALLVQAAASSITRAALAGEAAAGPQRFGTASAVPAAQDAGEAEAGAFAAGCSEVRVLAKRQKVGVADTAPIAAAEPNAK